MKKYKVIYDRKNCIGAGSCAAVQDNRWVMNDDDNKADLVQGQVKENDIWELEIGQDEVDEFVNAAQVCPVYVIKVIDLETGKEVS